jgi:hypothetical protein
MSVKVVYDEAWRRGLEKSLSREMDDHLLSWGKRSQLEMAIENDVFASLNLSGFKISAIGGRAVSRVDD